MTQVMGHPPGGENEPDDRTSYVPPDGYEEEPNPGEPGQGMGGPVEGQPQPPPDGAAWSQEQLQVRSKCQNALLPPQLILEGIPCVCAWGAALDR